MGENNIIITRREKVNKVLNFIKSYTAQIALLTPILGFILNGIVNVYLYIMGYGFYNYYCIDKENMIISNTYNIYNCIIMGVMAIFYFCYSTLAVRRTIISKNFLNRLLWWIILPFVINIIIILSSYNEFNIDVLFCGLILLPFQWIMIFSIGYCYAMPVNRDVWDKNREKNKKKSNTRIKWKDKDCKFLGLLLIVIALIGGGIFAYWTNYGEAKDKRIYGVVNVKSNQYALIGTGDNKFILQQCDIEKDKKKLVIYTDTYLCLEKDGILVYYSEFTDVCRKKIDNIK